MHRALRWRGTISNGAVSASAARACGVSAVKAQAEMRWSVWLMAEWRLSSMVR